MDQDMLNVDHAFTDVAPGTGPDTWRADVINTSTEAAPVESQEDADFVAELEAMLDADAATEEARVVAEAFEQAHVAQEELDTEMEEGHNNDQHSEEDRNANHDEDDTEYEPPPASAFQPLPASMDEAPLASRSHFLRSQFMEIEQPHVLESQTQETASQQFLNQARHHLQEMQRMSWTGEGMRV